MPDPTNCGAEDRAQEVYVTLNDTFSLPVIDLSDGNYELPTFATGILSEEPTALTNLDLTSGNIAGSGTFDVIMASYASHLAKEHEDGRITGDQYAKAYIELTSSALSGAVQYLLGKDQAKWQAVLVQSQAKRAEIEAVSAGVALQTAKAQLAVSIYESQRAASEVALTKMKLATEDAAYCAQIAQTEQVKYQTETMLPNQNSMVTKQIDQLDAQIAQVLYQTANLLPAQKILVEEQGEAQRAQTLDTRSDNTPVSGSVGKQKALYDQQIDSYIKDAQYKVAKMYMDSFITQKTITETIDPPDELKTAQLEIVMNAIRTTNNLGS